jgi:putative transposase
VYNILKRNGLIKPLSKPRHKRTYKRFSRRRPDSLWRADLTIFRRKYVIVFMDDGSMFLTAIEWFSAPKADLVIDAFDDTIKEYGMPRNVLTDHGTQLYSVRGGTSPFDQYCHDHKIRHIMGGIAKPTTQGKIERFFCTLKNEYGRYNDLGEYADHYNNRRRHAGIGYLTPASKKILCL